ncbi:MAG TPA: lytic transglycosylase domain-containing protein [Solimonas sp.]
MGESNLACIQWSRRRRSRRAVLFAVLCTASLQVAAAEPLKLYLHKDRGMPVYTSLKPDNVEYTVVYPGSGAARPVLSLPPSDPAVDNPNPESAEVLVGWAASCKGVSKQAIDQRAVQWQDQVARQAEAHGVPVALVHAVIRVESCFDPRALSRVGARGLMQLMPKTAEHLGVADSFDGDQNIAGGVRYLSQLLNRFENDTRLAVAAYNAGPTAVDAYGGIPPFSETRKYVERVLAEYRERSPAAPKKPKG